MKKIILVLTLFLLTATYTGTAFSQTVKSNCVQTQVGNPTGSPSLPPECQTTSSDNALGSPSNSSDILSWAGKITTGLTPGEWSFYNDSVGVGNICNTDGYCAHEFPGNDPNLYWCTYLVVDAYNLAGHQGLTIGDDGAVVNMMSHWKSLPGYIFYPYDPDNPNNPENQATLSRIHPGVAFFLAVNPNQTINEEHTGLVKSITIDSNGNGSLTTYESDSDKTSHTFTIIAWTVIGTFFPLRGFGGV